MANIFVNPDDETVRQINAFAQEWYKNPSGDPCPWCKDGDASPFEPDDDDDAEQLLCRGHLAEYLGESLASLDRMEAAEHADMEALGYFDR